MTRIEFRPYSSANRNTGYDFFTIHGQGVRTITILRGCTTYFFDLATFFLVNITFFLVNIKRGTSQILRGPPLIFANLRGPPSNFANLRRGLGRTVRPLAHVCC